LWVEQKECEWDLTFPSLLATLSAGPLVQWWSQQPDSPWLEWEENPNRAFLLSSVATLRGASALARDSVKVLLSSVLLLFLVARLVVWELPWVFAAKPSATVPSLMEMTLVHPYLD
jgi:hypothetical protein